MNSVPEKTALRRWRWTMLGLSLFATPGFGAQCPLDVDQAASARKAVAEGRQAQAAGEFRIALSFYLLARDYDCENRTGIAVDALRLAAPVARRLAEAAQRAGDPPLAFDYYERGGLFAAADAALLAAVADPETGIDIFHQARTHFAQRLAPGFASAHRLALETAGPYVPRREHLDALESLPATAATTLLARESQWLTADYIETYARIARRSEFEQPVEELVTGINTRYPARFGRDRLEDSQRLLRLAQRWAAEIEHPDLRQRISARVRSRLVERGDQVVSGHTHAPLMLRVAEIYYTLADAPERIAAMKARAKLQGNHELAAGNTALALTLYLLADADASATELMQSMEFAHAPR